MTDKDNLVFTVEYLTVEQFKRHFHTMESHARYQKCKAIVHKLTTGEILKETRLDAVSS